ncbi:hypothetical protein ACVDG3_22830, partial [Meridianimarinicoccus sp. RP-17]
RKFPITCSKPPAASSFRGLSTRAATSRPPKSRRGPHRKTFRKDDCPAARVRNETLRATRHYGRAFWKRWTGYHARSRIEARMRGLKSFGERIMAKDPDRQTAEIHIRIALMNRFNALGTAEIIRVA